MIAFLAVRVVQLVMAGVVLGLSAVMVKNYGPGHAPSILAYGAFCGGAAIVIAAIGIVALFIEALQGIIILGLDGLASFFVLAGAAAFAAKVKSGDCTNRDYLESIASVIKPSPDITFPDATRKNIETVAFNYVVTRCREAQADTAFLWILAICFLGSVALAFFTGGAKRSNRIV